MTMTRLFAVNAWADRLGLIVVSTALVAAALAVIESL
jgi:hypothetical protein